MADLMRIKRDDIFLVKFSDIVLTERERGDPLRRTSVERHRRIKSLNISWNPKATKVSNIKV